MVTIAALLIARKALIVILIVISPLAFVAFLLPNTEKFFSKWRSTFVGLPWSFQSLGCYSVAVYWRDQLLKRELQMLIIRSCKLLVSLIQSPAAHRRVGRPQKSYRRRRGNRPAHQQRRWSPRGLWWQRQKLGKG